jgi:osmoprotectant transport system permease protein
MAGKLRAIAGLLGFVLAAAALLKAVFLVVDAQERTSPAHISIGSKADTEGLVLAEIMAQLIEQRGSLTVARRTQLGGTQICFQALLAGEIDLYPEYTGTALVALLNRPAVAHAGRTFAIARNELAVRYGLELLEPLAFNNTYALAMNDTRAGELEIRTISDLKAHPTLRAGFTAEFIGRRDGYAGLEQAYGLHFDPAPASMEAGLMYEAVARGQVDVIDAYATDGRIEKLHLRILTDDRAFFPPYQAAPLLGSRTSVEIRKRIRGALRMLAGRLTDAEMRKLNAAVDLQHRAPSVVAREYVQSLLTP